MSLCPIIKNKEFKATVPCLDHQNRCYFTTEEQYGRGDTFSEYANRIVVCSMYELPGLLKYLMQHHTCETETMGVGQ